MPSKKIEKITNLVTVITLARSARQILNIARSNIDIKGPRSHAAHGKLVDIENLISEFATEFYEERKQ